MQVMTDMALLKCQKKKIEELLCQVTGEVMECFGT